MSDQPLPADYEAARHRAVLFDLSDRGKIELTGPEASIFLHNLASNDIKNLPYSRGVETFFCTVQARVLAWGMVWHLKIFDDHACVSGHDAFWLDVDPGQNERLMKHLDRHLISERAEIFDRTGTFTHHHLAGPQAPTLLAAANITGLANGELMQAGWGDGTVQFRRRDCLGVPGYDLLCSAGRFETLRETVLGQEVVAGSKETFEILRIEAGTPVYGKDIDESHLAPEVNRTSKAISYNKGCYLGQEPIVRIRDLGHVNRVLMRFKLSSEGGAPPVGTRLFREGKEVGQVMSAALSPSQGSIALAYVRRGHSEPGTVLEVGEGGSSRRGEVMTLIPT